MRILATKPQCIRCPVSCFSFPPLAPAANAPAPLRTGVPWSCNQKKRKGTQYQICAETEKKKVSRHFSNDESKRSLRTKKKLTSCLFTTWWLFMWAFTAIAISKYRSHLRIKRLDGWSSRWCALIGGMLELCSAKQTPPWTSMWRWRK